VLNINAEIKALKHQNKLVAANDDSRLSDAKVHTVTNVLTWLNSGLSDRCDDITLYKWCPLFVDQVCLRQIRKCKPAKLSLLLQEARPLPSLGTSQLLGLTIALLVTEDTIQCLPAFLQAMEESRRVQLLLQLPKHLQIIFPLSDVNEWIAKNWRHLNIQILKLAEKLCS
jgi:hypothetical protein